MQETSESDPNDTVRRHQELPGDARRDQERPGEDRRYQKGSRIIQIHPWISNISKPAEKACEPYAPLTFIIFFGPDIVRLAEILQDTGELDPNDTVRRHQELRKDAGREVVISDVGRDRPKRRRRNQVPR